MATVFTDIAQYHYFCAASNAKMIPDNVLRDELFTHYDSTMHQALLHYAEKDSISGFPISKQALLAKNVNFPINEDYKPRCEYYIGLKVLRRSLFDQGKKFQ